MLDISDEITICLSEGTFFTDTLYSYVLSCTVFFPLHGHGLVFLFAVHVLLRYLCYTEKIHLQSIPFPNLQTQTKIMLNFPSKKRLQDLFKLHRILVRTQVACLSAKF